MKTEYNPRETFNPGHIKSALEKVSKSRTRKEMAELEGPGEISRTRWILS